MENTSQLQASTGLRRENESMDDFEHLEAESTSPVKETSYDKLSVKDTKPDNLKTDNDSSPLVKVPAESRNSSDFSLLSDYKLDSPAADNSSVFTMEDTARKLEELTSTTGDSTSVTDDNILAEFSSQHVPEIDMFSKFDSKVDSDSVLQSFLTSEKVGGVSDLLKDGMGTSSNVDLLNFESAGGMGDIVDIHNKHSIPVIKDDEDSFKDTIPEIIRTADKAERCSEEIRYVGPAPDDVFKDVLADTITSTMGKDLPSDENILHKYKSDHEDDEEFNLAASQDSSPIKMADKLEQYNIKPGHEIGLKTELSDQTTDESLVIEGEKVSMGGASTEKLTVLDDTPPVVSRQTKPKIDIPVIAPAALSLPLDSWFKPERLHPRVESLVYWRNPKVSGAVLGIGLALLLSLAYCSLISVIAYVSLAVLIGCGGFRLYRAVMAAVNKTGEGHPFRELLDQDIAISPDRAASLAQQIVPHINASIAELRRLFLVEDILDTLKFAVMVWALTYVGAIFNGLTLVILAYVSAFTLPRLYENNKQQIDKNLELVRAQIAEITAKVQAFNPLSGAAAKKVAGAAGSEEKKEN